MIADPLTKAMDPARMVNTLMTGKLDLRPTPESLAIKEKNRQLRKNKKENEKQQKEEAANKEAQERQDIRKDLEDKKIKAAIRQRKSTCTTRRNHRW